MGQDAGSFHGAVDVLSSDNNRSHDVAQIEGRPPATLAAHLQAAGGAVEYWYTRQQALVFVLALFLLATFLASLTPPFQAPDEFNHVKRAYLLTRGQLVIGSKSGVTGAPIDTGLLNYMECFRRIPFNYGAKATEALTKECNEIRFSGTMRFSSLANTAMYFPLLYVPQSVAIFLGSHTNMTVAHTYQIARMVSQCVTLAVLLWALYAYPMPPPVIAVFFLPMSLSQLASTSQDALSFATTVLACSLFLKAYNRNVPFRYTELHALAICLFALAASRIVYVVLIPLLLVLYIRRRSWSYLASFIAAFSVAVAWIGYAMATVHGRGAIPRAAEPSDIAKYYLAHPISFAQVMLNTFSDREILEGYWRMFVGVLGWVDTPLGSQAYVSFAVLLALMVAVSVPKVWKRLTGGNAALVGAAAASLVLLSLVALMAFTEHPAKQIHGIEGRYLYPIVIIMLYAAWDGTLSRRAVVMSLSALLLFAYLSVNFTVPRLLSRYWVDAARNVDTLSCGNLSVAGSRLVSMTSRDLLRFGQDWGSTLSSDTRPQVQQF